MVKYTLNTKKVIIQTESQLHTDLFITHLSPDSDHTKVSVDFFLHESFFPLNLQLYLKLD